jgi:hypothetical protein
MVVTWSQSDFETPGLTFAFQTCAARWLICVPMRAHLEDSINHKGTKATKEMRDGRQKTEANQDGRLKTEDRRQKAE